MLLPGQILDRVVIDISWMSPPHHIAATIEDEAHVIPVIEVVGLHVIVGMWDVQATEGQAPGMEAVVFAHALGEVFEVWVFHEKKRVGPPSAAASIDTGMGVV